MDHPIDIASSILGSQAALASALGVTRAAVAQWKEEGRKTPAEHCPKIERLTLGVVTCEQLRPDMEWAVLRLQAAPVIPARPTNPTAPTVRAPSEAPTAAEPRREIVVRGPEKRDRPGELGGRRHGHRREG